MDAADLKPTLSDVTMDYDYQSYYEDYKTSNMPSDSSSVDYEYILQKMTITLYAIIFALGIIGNGLVIWIAGFRMKKTISAVWFLNLAIADFLCCASLPLRIAEWALHRSWLPIIICVVTLILFNLNMSASVLLLKAMSIDRCVSVMWPFWAKVHRTRKLVRITAAIIWALSLFSTGFVFYIYIYYFHDLTEWCALVYDYRIHYLHNIKLTIQLIRLFMMFVIPFLIISISYVIIFIKIRKSKRPQRSQRPYRIITAVILGFFICWLPYYIWPLTPLFGGDYIKVYMANTLVTILAYLNSCINPIIYVFLGQDFKLGFFRSIPTRLKRALSEHPNDQCREREDCEHACVTYV